MWEGRGCVKLVARICRHYLWKAKGIGNNADIWDEELTRERQVKEGDFSLHPLLYLLSI